MEEETKKEEKINHPKYEKGQIINYKITEYKGYPIQISRYHEFFVVNTVIDGEFYRTHLYCPITLKQRVEYLLGKRKDYYTEKVIEENVAVLEGAIKKAIDQILLNKELDKKLKK